MAKRKLLFHHDNASDHSSAFVVQKLYELDSGELRLTMKEYFEELEKSHFREGIKKLKYCWIKCSLNGLTEQRSRFFTKMN